MSKLYIRGGKKLSGDVEIHGAKNSALPILAATFICNGESVIHNCPGLSDIDASLKILAHLGCKTKREGDTVTVDAKGAYGYKIPNELMREMRSSIVFLGAIAAKSGRAVITSPGGCELGPRPIDLHLQALRSLGLTIDDACGRLDCFVEEGGLRGTDITLSIPSVGATENIMLASCTAKGTTRIYNAAREPEITDLEEFLNKCGANIQGSGESTITIVGVDTLSGAEHKVIPDRIAASTFMAAAAVTGGNIVLREINSEHLGPILPCFVEAGCEMRVFEKKLVLTSPNRLQRIRSIKTLAYPGFPTDSQPPIMAMTTVADGTSMFVETIFENRYKHVSELVRMGADIQVEGRVASVEGVKRLRGAQVESTDLRGGAALIIAALAADGTTVVDGIKHVDRGYDRIEKSLASIGADIERY